MKTPESQQKYYIMEPESAYAALPAREDLHVEFKDARSGLPGNLCDTLCAFLNTDGGMLYLGVSDKGEVLGLEPEQIERYRKEIASLSNNPQKVDPPYLLFPREETIGNKHILIVQVPLSSQLHRHKGEIYLRSDEGDYRVKGSHQLAGLLNRKLGIFTEQTPMPQFSHKDLRPDLFERARTLMRRRNQNHPWLDLDMNTLLRTAGLYTPADPPSRTLTLAAILLFGTDVAIRQAAPAYTFDCLLRRHNTDRYDDRLMIDTNLIDAYDLMMGFVEKHLNDPFYLENGATISLRERIFREAISNIISHREYRDATPARLMIYKDRVVLDNPAMAYFHTRITPQNLRSHPKNPSICKFMIQIGRFDQLGSGVLNIHKYWPIYAPGTDPVFRETRHGFELNLALGESAKMAVPTKSGPESGLESRLESAPATPQVTQQVTPQVTPQVAMLVSVCSGAMSRAELQAKLALKDRMSFVEQYLQPSIEKGFIALTIPEKPNSRLQKYRLTEKGRLAAGKSEKPRLRPESGLESAPATPQVAQQVTQQVTPQVAMLVSVCSGAMSRSELQAKLALNDRMSFVEQYLQPAIEKGFIELTIPEKPSSRLQKYRLTEKGRLAAGKSEKPRLRPESVQVTPQVAPQVTPQVTQQVTQQVTPQVAQQVAMLVSVCSGAMSRAELQAKLALNDRMSFVEKYLQPAIEEGFIALTIPEKPSSRLQKYRLTEKGRLAAEKGKEGV